MALGVVIVSPLTFRVGILNYTTCVEIKSSKLCGIYGIFGSGIIKADLSAVRTLGFINMMRGMDSTGVARVFHATNREVEITKDTVPALNFFNDKENRRLTEDCSPVAVMCHNRHATVGKADDIRGAHPFQTDRYVGFHNGTLKEAKYTTDSDFFTDSESLYQDIEARGFSEVLAPLYEDSAFALAYYDKKENKIGFVRNSKRPLAFAVHQRRNVVFYSSDLDDLRYVMTKHDMDTQEYTIAPWQHIRTNPRALEFGSSTNSQGRVNLWKIDKITPTPEAPPVKENVYSFHSPGTYTHKPSVPYKPLACKVCDDSLSWARAGQSKKENPKWVRDFGNICHKCQIVLEDMYGIDLDDEHASAFIGAAGITPFVHTVQ